MSTICCLNDQRCAGKILSVFFFSSGIVYALLARERSFEAFAQKKLHAGIKSRCRYAVCHQLCIKARVKNIASKNEQVLRGKLTSKPVKRLTIIKSCSGRC